MYHKRSKHIEIKYDWVPEHVDPDGKFRTARLVHVRTAEHTADIFTKALTKSDLREKQEQKSWREEKGIDGGH